MKMGLCWMLLILLGCRSSQATQFPSTCACYDEPKIHVVPTNGSVLVPCPNVTGEDLTFELRKGQEVIYNHTCTSKDNCKFIVTRKVKPFKNGENKLLGFNLTEGSAESKRIYGCTIIRKYPPPLLLQSGQRILVVDAGFNALSSQPNSSNITTKQDSRETQRYPWIWITVVALLGVYSLTATILALVYWMKLKTTDSQSDYMNTKPRAPKGNKKRGVQNPIPRYL